MKVIKENTLNEMVYDRRDAVQKCSDLGYQFVQHFRKILRTGTSSEDFHHHCKEMQSWYDQVKDIVLSYNKKRISRTQLLDWFFTYGSSVETLFGDDDSDTYEKFVFSILMTDDVESSARKVLEESNVN